MLNLRKIVILSVVIIACTLAGFFVYQEYSSRPQAGFFIGEITKIEGGYIYMDGYYVLDDLNSKEAIEQTKPSAVKVRVASDTKFKRIELIRPSLEETAKNNYTYKIEDLKRNETDVSLDILQKEFEEFGPRVKVTSSKNIFRKEEFKAVLLEYTIFASPFK
ncbi:MAG: hypothetical protein A3B91_02790 [Candidatus Yanofskybacteria bacterium RIFCSPHIGHO2_02_FULL_41_29]|uniref:Uncharacterized protein n=1 Tax=Candidatus Yanofskybacteria bacterium RIFCSPHIGHO2_01_FULL_41_53 TaxID=1802663 RepID=A0A1F8EJI5_9BACT|nr:MAG: hypothetical protein A2650_02140 [Candidatus Yanofskybacteria bacterium RIFCSPHIGHO2_01_FULL_41_53]OGN12191.1 MAG: hypothetical protein A3B91_02790 [Candidatus Yanofskybacteria bacterium RIFCSPHIGHO2_02_FULL_41_29]OGN16838.1 MAG: hypothetical protein A3F48_04300 [Candidatus Yanofskybacteria bacterium RIFCSPHIGHO2_12_FULL_41_9]OGN22216.1 MAG: hypothetical protein A2916_02325 [Candidatus Yanofskybacteria bacterium RIFCSPLOWO2_01_FULL_41_67]OGN28541.1 MAG: hypothetical protein A3H54_04775 